MDKLWITFLSYGWLVLKSVANRLRHPKMQKRITQPQQAAGYLQPTAVRHIVIPAKACLPVRQAGRFYFLDSRLRGNDIF